MLNVYKCHHNGRTTDVVAETTYQAQESAAKLWRVKGWKIATVLVAKGYCPNNGTVAEIVPMRTGDI